MNYQPILLKISSINLRQVIYVAAGIYFLITAIINKDWMLGILSALFLYQGVFNTCLFGSCRIPKRKEF
jgi:hypothetical protein